MKNEYAKRINKSMGALAAVGVAALLVGGAKLLLLAGGVNAAMSLTKRHYASPGDKMPNTLLRLRAGL